MVGCELSRKLFFFLVSYDIDSLIKRYTQCELMSVHYKHPVLLIEFEEDKAFSLDVCIFIQKIIRFQNLINQSLPDRSRYEIICQTIIQVPTKKTKQLHRSIIDILIIYYSIQNRSVNTHIPSSTHNMVFITIRKRRHIQRS